MSGQRAYEHYRNSSIGLALTDCLQELVDAGELDSDLQEKILVNFDKSIAESLAQIVKTKVTLKVCTCWSGKQWFDLLLGEIKNVPKC